MKRIVMITALILVLLAVALLARNDAAYVFAAGFFALSLMPAK